MSTKESEATNDQALAVVPKSLRWYLEDPSAGYMARLNQLLGARMPQFCSSLVNLANSSKAFKKVRPTSIITAGVIAATLDLPIDKNLGFAWIVPYGELAQFQIGYKGYVQLALRSGRYAGMNAVKVNAEALGGYDVIGDPLIKWDQLDETKPPVGYAFAWRLTSGFAKVVYWPKDKVEAHAQRYSQAYKQKKKDSPWFTNFDEMALKTLITNALRRWGIMSVEDRGMQIAYEADQSAAIDIDAVPFYPDNETDQPPDDEPPTDTPAPAGLGDLTEKLNGTSKAEPAADPRGAAPWDTKPAPPEPVSDQPIHLVPEAAKAAPMDLEEIKERLAKAEYVSDVRALKLLWAGPKSERSDEDRERIAELCDRRVDEIKSATWAPTKGKK
jgi:recombination protein RecT